MRGGCPFVQNMLKRNAFPFEETSCGGAKVHGSPVIKQKKILATLHRGGPGFPGVSPAMGSQREMTICIHIVISLAESSRSRPAANA
jgi:hypothetical protein